MFRDDDCHIFWYKLYEFLVPLIAAAIFYREPSFKSANAGMVGADNFECWNQPVSNSN